MTILNLIQCTNLGGMEQASLRLMRALKTRGHNFHVLSLNPLGALSQPLDRAGISCEGLEYKGKGGWRTALRLRQKLRKSRPDALIMTGHNLLAMMVLNRCGEGRRLLAVHFHHQGVKPIWQWRLIYGIARQRFQAISFPSDFVRLEAERSCPAIAPISCTLRNPLPVCQVPARQTRLSARAAFGLPEGAPVIGNAAWLIKRKRLDIFLLVAARVSAKYPDARFLVAGDGPERASLQGFAEKLGIRDRVTWGGWIADLTPFYASLDVLLFNSDFDALPTTPHEAMACGIPVVASALQGGLGETIISSDLGHLFASHNVEALSDAVCSLLKSPERAGAVGRAGQRRIAEMSDPARIAATCEKMLGGKNGPRIG